MHGASKINRLLRLTKFAMPRKNLTGLCRPESGECTLKIEGHSYAMVEESATHDNNAPLQFYLLDPEGETRRVTLANHANAWGGPVDPAVVHYFAKVLELTHPDVKNVCERLRGDPAATELAIAVDEPMTATTRATFIARTAP